MLFVQTSLVAVTHYSHIKIKIKLKFQFCSSVPKIILCTTVHEVVQLRSTAWENEGGWSNANLFFSSTQLPVND